MAKFILLFPDLHDGRLCEERTAGSHYLGEGCYQIFSLTERSRKSEEQEGD